MNQFRQFFFPMIKIFAFLCLHGLATDKFRNVALMMKENCKTEKSLEVFDNLLIKIVEEEIEGRKSIAGSKYTNLVYELYQILDQFGLAAKRLNIKDYDILEYIRRHYAIKINIASFHGPSRKDRIQELLRWAFSNNPLRKDRLLSIFYLFGENAQYAEDIDAFFQFFQDNNILSKYISEDENFVLSMLKIFKNNGTQLTDLISYKNKDLNDGKSSYEEIQERDYQMAIRLLDNQLNAEEKNHLNSQYVPVLKTFLIF